MSEELGAVLEAPVEETPVEEVVEQPAESAELDEQPEPEAVETETAESEDPAEPVVEEVSADGRKLPDDVKKGLASLKAVNQAAAGKLKDAWFQAQSYRDVFPKPADAIAAKDFIDQIGGQDGFAQFQTERDEWNALDRQFVEQPAEFAKSVAENNQDAFLNAAPHVINEWATRAPEQYGYYANTVTLNTLKAAGLDTEVLKHTYANYADNPQAQALIADIHNRIYGLQEKASQFQQKRLDPREEQLKQKEQKFEQERRAYFEEGVAKQALSFLDEKVKSEIGVVLNGRQADDAAMARYVKLASDEIAKRLGQVPGFKENLEAHYRSGDAQKSVDYIKTQYNRIVAAAVKDEVGPLVRNFANAPKPITQKPAPNGTPASPGTVVLKEMPDRSDVDWSKTTVADMMEGRAVLKNGKKATGWA